VKLRYEWVRTEEQTLSFHIRGQDSRFRAVVGEELMYMAKNGVRVCSTHRPELSSNTVYLRGSVNDYGHTATRTFGSLKKMKKYARKMDIALRDWADNCPIWGADSEEDPFGVREV